MFIRMMEGKYFKGRQRKDIIVQGDSNQHVGFHMAVFLRAISFTKPQYV